MYTLTNTTTILRADGASIPADPANIDYQAYQAWLAAGNTPTPAPVPTTAQQTLAQIVAIEQATPFTHRHLRDITDLMVQAIKTANPAVDLSVIPGIAAVAQVEAQIAALRSNLK